MVKALSLKATHHANFEYEMVDGAVAANDVEALGLLGVPAVVADNKLLYSGKIQLLDLLAKLEAHYSTESAATSPVDLRTFDVVVVGGGPAGASAAIYSAHKDLKTAIVA